MYVMDLCQPTYIGTTSFRMWLYTRSPMGRLHSDCDPSFRLESEQLNVFRNVGTWMEKRNHIRIAGFSGVFTLAPLSRTYLIDTKAFLELVHHGKACGRDGYARIRLARDCYAPRTCNGCCICYGCKRRRRIPTNPPGRFMPPILAVVIEGQGGPPLSLC